MRPDGVPNMASSSIMDRVRLFDQERTSTSAALKLPKSPGSPTRRSVLKKSHITMSPSDRTPSSPMYREHRLDADSPRGGGDNSRSERCSGDATRQLHYVNARTEKSTTPSKLSTYEHKINFSLSPKSGIVKVSPRSHSTGLVARARAFADKQKTQLSPTSQDRATVMIPPKTQTPGRTGNKSPGKVSAMAAGSPRRDSNISRYSEAYERSIRATSKSPSSREHRAQNPMLHHQQTVASSPAQEGRETTPGVRRWQVSTNTRGGTKHVEERREQPVDEEHDQGIVTVKEGEKTWEGKVATSEPKRRLSYQGFGARNTPRPPSRLPRSAEKENQSSPQKSATPPTRAFNPASPSSQKASPKGFGQQELLSAAKFLSRSPVDSKQHGHPSSEPTQGTSNQKFNKGSTQNGFDRYKKATGKSSAVVRQSPTIFYKRFNNDDNLKKNLDAATVLLEEEKSGASSSSSSTRSSLSGKELGTIAQKAMAMSKNRPVERPKSAAMLKFELYQKQKQKQESASRDTAPIHAPILSRPKLNEGSSESQTNRAIAHSYSNGTCHSDKTARASNTKQSRVDSTLFARRPVRRELSKPLSSASPRFTAYGASKAKKPALIERFPKKPSEAQPSITGKESCKHDFSDLLMSHKTYVMLSVDRRGKTEENKQEETKNLNEEQHNDVNDGRDGSDVPLTFQRQVNKDVVSKYSSASGNINKEKGRGRSPSLQVRDLAARCNHPQSNYDDSFGAFLKQSYLTASSQPSKKLQRDESKSTGETSHPEQRPDRSIQSHQVPSSPQKHLLNSTHSSHSPQVKPVATGPKMTKPTKLLEQTPFKHDESQHRYLPTALISPRELSNERNSVRVTDLEASAAPSDESRDSAAHSNDVQTKSEKFPIENLRFKDSISGNSDMIEGLSVQERQKNLVENDTPGSRDTKVPTAGLRVKDLVSNSYPSPQQAVPAESVQFEVEGVQTPQFGRNAFAQCRIPDSSSSLSDAEDPSAYRLSREGYARMRDQSPARNIDSGDMKLNSPRKASPSGNQPSSYLLQLKGSKSPDNHTNIKPRLSHEGLCEADTPAQLSVTSNGVSQDIEHFPSVKSRRESFERRISSDNSPQAVQGARSKQGFVAKADELQTNFDRKSPSKSSPKKQVTSSPEKNQTNLGEENIRFPTEEKQESENDLSLLHPPNDKNPESTLSIDQAEAESSSNNDVLVPSNKTPRSKSYSEDFTEFSRDNISAHHPLVRPTIDDSASVVAPMRISHGEPTTSNSSLKTDGSEGGDPPLLLLSSNSEPESTEFREEGFNSDHVDPNIRENEENDDSFTPSETASEGVKRMADALQWWQERYSSDPDKSTAPATEEIAAPTQAHCVPQVELPSPKSRLSFSEEPEKEMPDHLNKVNDASQSDKAGIVSIKNDNKKKTENKQGTFTVDENPMNVKEKSILLSPQNYSQVSKNTSSPVFELREDEDIFSGLEEDIKAPSDETKSLEDSMHKEHNHGITHSKSHSHSHSHSHSSSKVSRQHGVESEQQGNLRNSFSSMSIRQRGGSLTPVAKQNQSPPPPPAPPQEQSLITSTQSTSAHSQAKEDDRVSKSLQEDQEDARSRPGYTTLGSPGSSTGPKPALREVTGYNMVKTISSDITESQVSGPTSKRFLKPSFQEDVLGGSEAGAEFDGSDVNSDVYSSRSLLREKMPFVQKGLIPGDGNVEMKQGEDEILNDHQSTGSGSLEQEEEASLPADEPNPAFFLYAILDSFSEACKASAGSGDEHGEFTWTSRPAAFYEHVRKKISECCYEEEDDNSLVRDAAEHVLVKSESRLSTNTFLGSQSRMSESFADSKFRPLQSATSQTSMYSASVFDMTEDGKTKWSEWEEHHLAIQEETVTDVEEERETTPDKETSPDCPRDAQSSGSSGILIKENASLPQNHVQERRLKAQERLLQHTRKAKSANDYTKTLVAIMSEENSETDGGGSSAFELSVLENTFSPKSQHTTDTTLTNHQKNVLEQFSSMLRNDRVEVLKLNRHNKWQVRFLTVSKEYAWLRGNESDGDVGQCPQALLWLKSATGKNTGVAGIKDEGKGGFLFSQLEKIERDTSKAPPAEIPRKLRAKFPAYVGVKITYQTDDGSQRSLLFCLKNRAEARAFVTSMEIIRAVIQREEIPLKA